MEALDLVPTDRTKVGERQSRRGEDMAALKENRSIVSIDLVLKGVQRGVARRNARHVVDGVLDYVARR